MMCMTKTKTVLSSVNLIDLSTVIGSVDLNMSRQMLVFDREEDCIGILNEDDELLPVFRYNWLFTGFISSPSNPFRGYR